MNWLSTLFSRPSPLRHNGQADLDFPLLAGCVALLGLGLVMVTSASTEVAAVRNSSSTYYLTRQIAYLTLGALACIGAMLVPMKVWEKHRWNLLVLGVVLLALVFAPVIGKSVNGARRWLAFPLFNIQPSEIAKICLVVFIAGYLVHHKNDVQQRIRGFLKPMFILALFAGLLLGEPDFGATVVLSGTVMVMIFLGGMRMAWALSLIIFVVALGAFVVGTQEYRVQRLQNFIDPWADPYGAGYQLSQALIAFGRGEWLGLGLGNSIQKQFYLPEAHTDFVFSILAEELGLVGALVTFALLIFVSIRAIIIGSWAERSKQYFSAYIAYGLAFLWVGQILINIGVNIGLLPTKGLTLPFLSYGGSSLIICCVSLGMLLRIEWERRTHIAETSVNKVRMHSEPAPALEGERA
ncbi:putative lipid II flippase FtsW [Pseudomonas sp. F1_0610]|uniref:putative lipid II flippase FtsW n=1 Tax=Pseudomonas sp. F1_0610 TaxID=3114284 RepID=UPI0039C2A8BF